MHSPFRHTAVPQMTAKWAAVR